MFSNSLPTPASVEQMIKKQEQSKAQSRVPKPQIDPKTNMKGGMGRRSSQVFPDHSFAFAKSQEERATQFTTHLHTMHQGIASLHLQCHLAFTEYQMSFKRWTASKWLEHASTFQADQRRRGGEFNRAELARQELFMSRQRTRREMFEAAQGKRKARFEEKCRALREVLEEDETRMMAAFREWQERQENEMERRVRSWKGMFAADEMIRGQLHRQHNHFLLTT